MIVIPSKARDLLFLNNNHQSILERELSVARSSRLSAQRKLPSIKDRAKNIRVLLMDVDGVLTDGHVYLQEFPDGQALELKAFHSQDGAGLKIARMAGLRTGIISGRDSQATTLRA